MNDLERVSEQAKKIMESFQMSVTLVAEQVVVVGCSTSEVMGERIGSESNMAVANVIMKQILPILKSEGVYLAAQCCEHLNRALVVERACAIKYNLQEVLVLPHPKAGGSFASAAMVFFSDPIVVETIQADAGIDIGDTFIGMHIKPVGVPVRLAENKIGLAHVTTITRRPKLIGGSRAKYPEKSEGRKWEDWKRK